MTIPILYDGNLYNMNIVIQNRVYILSVHISIKENVVVQEDSFDKAVNSVFDALEAMKPYKNKNND